MAAHARCEPIRVGLSATCRDGDAAARFLVGPARSCRIVQAPPPPGTPPLEIKVQSLIRHDEAPHRGLSYRRLLRRLKGTIIRNRTTVIFANTRAFAEKLTHDLRHECARRDRGRGGGGRASLRPRRGQEARDRGALRRGELRAVVTSTSLELGVDIGTADVTVQVGLPGGVARCVQRVGRSGHRRGAGSRGLLLAATPAELAGAIITARAALAGRVEPLRMIRAPLDVVCQQLVSMACAGEQNVDEVFDLFRKSGSMADLTRADFDACLASLAGELAAPAGAFEPEPGAAPRWTSPRIWKSQRPVRHPELAGGPLVPKQRGDDSLRGDGAGHGRRRGGRHARGVLCRAFDFRRPIRPGRPRFQIPPAGELDRSRPATTTASQTCRGGRATGSRCHSSWPRSWPDFARKPHGG